MNPKNVNRAELLGVLESVKPGLTAKDLVEQSSCFLFKDGRVHTYNDEVACSAPVALGIEGAIKAKPLLALLKRCQNETVTISVAESELIVEGERLRATVYMEPLFQEVMKVPKRFKRLPDDFAAAIHSARRYVGRDASRFALTCVHISPSFVEACDNYQAIRYAIEVPIKKPLLVRGDSLATIKTLTPTAIAQEKKFVHFETAEGVMLSLRIHTDDYPNLDPLYEVEGRPVTFPKELAKAAERAGVFSAEIADANWLALQLANGKVTIEGVGNLGSCRESFHCDYRGPTIQAQLHPLVLVDIVKHGKECRIAQQRLWIVDGNMTYVAYLEKPRKGDKVFAAA